MLACSRSRDAGTGGIPAAPWLIQPPLQWHTRLRMDGLTLLGAVPAGVIAVVFFDPQYRGVLDRLQYGNEGVGRGRQRCALAQMDESTIGRFIGAIDRVLIPSGHLFLWLDKFHLCHGFRHWLGDSSLDVVDLIGWHKGRMGMGYRSRRTTEYCVVLQKAPRRAKGIWRVHNIPDTWCEAPAKGAERRHAHQKPKGLLTALVQAVTGPGDVVLDPAAGSFVVRDVARACDRLFLGCDLNG